MKLDFVPDTYKGPTEYLCERVGYYMPVDGTITSPFGLRQDPITGTKKTHNGVDIAAPEGTPIHASANGTVIVAKANDPTAGNYVIIKHADGFTTGYLHMKKFNTYQGDTVNAGEQIGEVGTTGRSTGPHTHWSMKNDQGTYVDPMQYVTTGLLPQTAGVHTGFIKWLGLGVLGLVLLSVTQNKK